ncbi:MAG: universal stress protein [Bacteroidales bacterium]|nr:universal stress protein [Bacteroidales bacterium]MCF8458612.1 universal stress protein [Bacteroidales bacterium]
MKTTDNKILVPVNFSEQSLIALEQSFNLAILSKAEIILLYVNKLSSSIWNIFSKDEQDAFTGKINEKLCWLAHDLSKDKDLNVRPVLRKGKVHEEVLKLANEENVSFIVMGTNNSSNMREKIIGNTTFRVVREASCPVITIKGEHHRNVCDHIILPLDLTKETREKVSHAIRFARLFNSTIHAVSVMSTKNKSQVKKLNSQLNQVVVFIKQAGIPCTAELLDVEKDNEKIANALIDHAHRKMGDLIIIMTQQENDIVEYFVGSMASEIIFRSDVPVMSIVPTFKHNYSSGL